jgi:hypothetical protein
VGKGCGLKIDIAKDFGRFLDRSFREHDFAVGRLEAREWLKHWLLAHFRDFALSPADKREVLVTWQTRAPHLHHCV